MHFPLLLLLTVSALVAASPQGETNSNTRMIRQNICKLPMDKGPCKAYKPRFYYEMNTNECHWFVYGGCRGNQNNFKTIEECRKTCQEDKVTENMRYYYA